MRMLKGRASNCSKVTPVLFLDCLYWWSFKLGVYRLLGEQDGIVIFNILVYSYHLK